ncbi:MAG: hypothetical protein ISR96_11755 [Nitrospira sp.]|nr:hypothetical protein [Nitrospira sp.]
MISKIENREIRGYKIICVNRLQRVGSETYHNEGEEMEIKDEHIDELIKGYQNPEEILGENGLLKQLTKAVLERCLQGDLSHHLGYGKHEVRGR